MVRNKLICQQRGSVYPTVALLSFCNTRGIIPDRAKPQQEVSKRISKRRVSMESARVQRIRNLKVRLLKEHGLQPNRGIKLLWERRLRLIMACFELDQLFITIITRLLMSRSSYASSCTTFFCSILFYNTHTSSSPPPPTNNTIPSLLSAHKKFPLLNPKPKSKRELASTA